MKNRFFFSLLALGLLATPFARAGTIESFNVDATEQTYFVTGGTSVVDLTFSCLVPTAGGVCGPFLSFSETDVITAPGGSPIDTVTYGLGDLTLGTAVFNISGILTNLQITSDYKTGTDGTFGPTSTNESDSAGTWYNTTSASAPGDSHGLDGDAQGFTGSVAQVATATTPEPSSLLLLGTGIFAAGFIIRKRVFGGLTAR